MGEKKSRAEKLGIMLANMVIEAAHMTYNAPRGIKIVKACIKQLQERIDEIQPKKADPNYKESRYGKKANDSPGRKLFRRVFLFPRPG